MEMTIREFVDSEWEKLPKQREKSCKNMEERDTEKMGLGSIDPMEMDSLFTEGIDCVFFRFETTLGQSLRNFIIDSDYHGFGPSFRSIENGGCADEDYKRISIVTCDAEMLKKKLLSDIKKYKEIVEKRKEVEKRVQFFNQDILDVLEKAECSKYAKSFKGIKKRHVKLFFGDVSLLKLEEFIDNKFDRLLFINAIQTHFKNLL